MTKAWMKNKLLNRKEIIAKNQQHHRLALEMMSKWYLCGFCCYCWPCCNGSFLWWPEILFPCFLCVYNRIESNFARLDIMVYMWWFKAEKDFARLESFYNTINEDEAKCFQFHWSWFFIHSSYTKYLLYVKDSFPPLHFRHFAISLFLWQ